MAYKKRDKVITTNWSFGTVVRAYDVALKRSEVALVEYDLESK